MALYKYTFFFQIRAYGWSESFYRDTAVATSQLTAGLDAYINRRRALMGSTGGVIGYRISTVDASPAASIVDIIPPVPDSLAPGKPGTINAASDQPNVAVLIRCRNAVATKSKLIYMRGVPDSYVNLGGVLEFPAGFSAAFDQWVTSLKGMGFGWRRKGAPTIKVISDIEALPNHTVRITTDGNTFEAGDVGKVKTVRLKGVMGASQLNGSRLVTVTAQDTMVTVKPLAILPWTGGGSVRYATLTNELIDDCDPERAVTRKCGRPFGLSAGRAKVRRAA